MYEATGFDFEPANPYWYCSECKAQNHYTDGECQYCDKHECYVMGKDYVEDGPNFCSRCKKPWDESEDFTL